jgi:oligopeptide transport system permease protein
MGDHLGDLITGSIVVEHLFAVPGIGEKFVTSVQQRDYGMIMGTTLFYATLVLTINLVVDLLYAVIDPRIKLGASARS